MRVNLLFLPLLLVIVFRVSGSMAAEAQSMNPPCSTTAIGKIVMPSGPARYQAGRLTLKNGAVLEVAGAKTDPAIYQVGKMRVGDRVAACYGRPTKYADAGRVRTITILDLRNGQFFGTLVGNWTP